MSDLYAFYDLALSPATFDLANFLVLAEVARSKGSYDCIRLLLVPDVSGQIKADRLHEEQAIKGRLRTILLPLIRLMPTCSTVQVLSCRDELNQYGEIFSQKNVFPTGYTPDLPASFYSWQAVWDASTNNADIQTMRAPSYICDKVDLWGCRNKIDFSRVVTLTLRESTYQLARNSSLLDWINFADYLTKKGYIPIFIRDYEKLGCEAKSDFPAHFIVCSQASKDLLFRIALYEKSFLNYFVNNGPWVVALFNKFIAHIGLKIITEEHFVTSTLYRINCGDPIGHNYCFLKPWQKVIWKDDSFVNLVSSFENYNDSVKQDFLLTN